MGSVVRRSWIKFAAGLLLASGAGAAIAQDLVSPGYSFLKAVRERDGDKVQKQLDAPGNTMILSRDDSTGETALHIVTKRRDIVWVRYVLAKGVSINGRDRQGNTALLDAAQIGFVDGEQQLIDVGAAVDLANNRGETPLIIATQAHDLASVRLLVAHGADPKEADHVAGMSAYDYAKRDGRSDAILKLFDETKPVVKRKVSGPSLN
jgi:uncharacterized protein